MWCSVEREGDISWHLSPWLASPYEHFCIFLLWKQEQDYVTQKAMRKQNDVNCNWHNLSCNYRQLFHLCFYQGLFYLINLGWLLFVRACRPESTCFLPELRLPKLTLQWKDDEFDVKLRALSLSIGSLSKDDGNGKDNARKQWSDWLNEENNRAARAARTLAEFFDVVC